MKCPACGFDSPEGAEWCDFCKEPFRKKKAPKPPPAPLPPAPAPAEAKPADSGSVPSEFTGFETGERIPIVPGWVRIAAWGFLALWALLPLLVFGLYLGRKALGR
ncbi:MAG: hypothetical protein NTX64_06515 [Elusimicrobia bacterium]|nr:hypothetical protein [Elusimicrobiota bacterium]